MHTHTHTYTRGLHVRERPIYIFTRVASVLLCEGMMSRQASTPTPTRRCNAPHIAVKHRLLASSLPFCVIMFDDIPDGCVAHILERLLSVHDVFNFQRTCSRFAKIGRTHQATWLSWLRKDFDIRLEVRWSPLLFPAQIGTVAQAIQVETQNSCHRRQQRLTGRSYIDRQAWLMYVNLDTRDALRTVVSTKDVSSTG